MADALSRAQQQLAALNLAKNSRSAATTHDIAHTTRSNIAATAAAVATPKPTATAAPLAKAGTSVSGKPFTPARPWPSPKKDLTGYVALALTSDGSPRENCMWATLRTSFPLQDSMWFKQQVRGSA